MDKEERGNATLLLASLLDQVSELPEGDIVHLCDFFCDRIKDHHSIVPHVLSASLVYDGLKSAVLATDPGHLCITNDLLSV